MDIRICKLCKVEFVRTTRGNQLYCCPEHRIEANKDVVYAAATRCHQERPEASILKSLRHRAKARGLEFNLTKEDIVIPTHCPIMGFELVHNWGMRGGAYNSPSVDRIDNKLGYVKGNIQIISRLANAMKSDARPEQLLMFADWIYKTYGGNKNGN